MLYDKILTAFKRSRLQQKITISFILLITLVLLFVTSIAYVISSRATLEQTIKNTDQNLDLIVEKIDFLSNELKIYSKIIIANGEIQYLVGKESLDYNQIKSVERLLLSYLDPRTFIDAAIIYSTKDIILAPEIIKLNNGLSPADLNAIYERIDSGENEFSSLTRADYYYRDYISRDVISFYYMMNDAYSGRRIGTLELSITEQFIFDFYSSVKIGDTGEIFIADQNGVILSAKDKSIINLNIKDMKVHRNMQSTTGASEIVKINGVRTLLLSKKHDILDWQVICAVPVDELTRDIKIQSLAIVLSGLLATLLASFIIMRISRSIAMPIIKLCTLIERTTPGDFENLNNFDAVNSSYEVSRLGNEFKALNTKTMILMDEINEAHKSEKEHELNMIQLQMNPHFLYNTLEAVCGLIDLNQQDKAIDLVNMIAEFYRNVLSKGKTTVKVRDDLEIMKCYLDIINVRYNNRLNYTIDIEERVLSQTIIKLTIQPIVENSLVHGLIGKRDEWNIAIHGCVSEGNVVISIKDNGIGLSAELFNKMMYSNSEDKKQGFALRGTDERIRLHFGPAYGIKLNEKFTGGTDIMIVLPYYEVEDD